tara:strand:- start:2414 stop:3358 length:945 start_codon:yes stop_codon:yes gene_type:complete
MKKLSLLSSTLAIPCLLMSGAMFAVEQNTEQYAGIHKQLSIMSDIIKSSVKDKSSRQSSKINSIQSTYLRGQGVVFTISSAASDRQWGHYNFNFSMPELPEMPVAPIAPEVNQDFHEKYDIDVNKTVTQALESAAVGYERVVEVFESNRDKTRELREEQRELAYNLRDIEREKRDVNYQLSRASDERKVELKQELSKLAEQEKKLQANQRKVTQLTNEVVAKQQAEQAQRSKERSQYYQQLAVTLTETLCLYGNGLKALPKNEHVSLILQSAGAKSAGRYKDSILVFSKEDIADCSADKMTAERLMNKGQAYQF